MHYQLFLAAIIQKCNFIDPQLPSYVISPTLLISGQISWSILPEMVYSGNFGLTKLVISSRNQQFWFANPEIDFIGNFYEQKLTVLVTFQKLTLLVS